MEASLTADVGGEGMDMGLDERSRHTASTSSAPTLEHVEDMDGGSEDDLFDDGADAQETPALYLRRFWRQVTSEKPSFACHRNPKSELTSLRPENYDDS